MGGRRKSESLQRGLWGAEPRAALRSVRCCEPASPAAPPVSPGTAAPAVRAGAKLRDGGAGATAPREPCSPSGLGNGSPIRCQRAGGVLRTQPSRQCWKALKAERGGNTVVAIPGQTESLGRAKTCSCLCRFSLRTYCKCHGSVCKWPNILKIRQQGEAR